jgi:hypothetical protein
MAITFKNTAKKYLANQEILIPFRTACKYDSDFLRIEQYLWEECFRRNHGNPVIPDKEYNRERFGLFLDTDRVIGDMDEFFPKSEKTTTEEDNVQTTTSRL